MALPKFIYVYEDQDNDSNKYFVATTDPGERDNGLVGIYDLREILEVRHKLQFKKRGTKNWFDSTKD